MKPRKQKQKGFALLFLPFFFLAVFFFLPLGNIASFSFSHLNAPGIVPQTHWNIIWSSSKFTLLQALLSTIFTVLIGLPAAFMFGRFIFAGKDLLRIASTLPFILPTVVVAAGLNALLGINGWLNSVLISLFHLSRPPISIMNSLAAILLAHIFYNTSIIIRVVGAALARMDQKLEMAARTLGASPWMAFRKVTLPALFPSIISAVLLVFLFDFTSFGVILMMGGPRFSTLEVEIYIQTMHFLNLPMAGVLSLIQLIFTMLVTFLLMKVDRVGFGIPVMPKLHSENMRKPSMFWEKMLCVGVIFLLGLLLIAPVAGLVFRSVLISEPAHATADGQRIALSFRHFSELFFNRRESFFYVPPITAVWNSLRFAFGSSLIALTLSLLMAYGLRYFRSGNRIIELVMMFPLGTSAVTMGLGFFMFFSGGTGFSRWYPVLIPLAHTLISLPFVFRVIHPVLNSIPENYRLAASSLGASPLNVVLHVDLPIIWRSLMTAILYAFTISLGEFGATSFLTSPDFPTMPVAIFRYLNIPGDANYGQAMAMAMIILMVCVAGMVVLDRLQYPRLNKTN